MNQNGRAPLFILAAAVLLTLFLWNVPFAGYVLSPLDRFVTTLHELGHAIATVCTGGSVSGLTIVSDGKGHGGLTMTRGGIDFITIQAGYLGTAIFGCIFIVLGSRRERCKPLLIGLGVVFALATLFFMTRAIGKDTWQGIWSVFWGTLLSAGLIVAGRKLSPLAAQLVVAFLSAVTALNALTDVFHLFLTTIGFAPTGSFSDATAMAALTHIPAVLWSLFWGGAASAMLYCTVRWTYLSKPVQE